MDNGYESSSVNGRHQWIQVQVTLDAGPGLGEGRAPQLMTIKTRPAAAASACWYGSGGGTVMHFLQPFQLFARTSP